MFVRHGRKRSHHKQCRLMPTMHVKIYATSDDPNEQSFSWDTDGMPFVIGNSATAIICYSRKSTRIRKSLGDKVNFAFSSAYSIDPELDKKDEVPTKPAVISYDTCELDEEPPPFTNGATLL